jgi:hypothetical protein
VDWPQSHLVAKRCRPWHYQKETVALAPLQMQTCDEMSSYHLLIKRIPHSLRLAEGSIRSTNLLLLRLGARWMQVFIYSRMKEEKCVMND